MGLLELFDIRLPEAADVLDERHRASMRADARREIILRAQRGITIYPAFFAVLGVGTEAAADHPWTYFSLFAVAVVLLGVRWTLARAMSGLSDERVPRFQIYLLCGWISSTALTLFVAALVLWYGDRPVVFIGELGMTGVSAGIVGVMAIHRPLARIWVFSGVVPLAVCNLWMGSSLAYSLSAMLVLYMLLSMPILDRSHEMYWRAQLSAIALDQRAQETVKLARWAGMAEVAASVLHDVGNVLNSVRISAQTIDERLCSNRGDELRALVELVRAHPGDLAEFLRDDARGKLVWPYLERVAAQLEHDRNDVRSELERLSRNLDHMANVVSSQQEHARGGRTREVYPVEQLVREAIELVTPDLRRGGFSVLLEVRRSANALVSVHQSLQVLVNLLTNARDAMDQLPRGQVVHVVVDVGSGGQPIVVVRDHGVGIAPEAAAKIFTHAFTTKQRGHGFGLHHSFLVTKAMGGRLEFHSDGVGKGASFTLVLPTISQVALAA